MATETGTCPRCRSETAADDNFCQECGTKLPGAITDSGKPPDAILTCLNCGTQHGKAMKFCGSCGSLMADIGVYTTTTRAAQIPGDKEWMLPKLANTTVSRATEAAAPAETAEPAPRTVPKTTLQSPLLQRSVNPSDFQGPLAYKPQNISRPLLDLSIAVLVLTFFGLLVWWLVDLERSKSPFSRTEGLIQAQAAMGSQHLNEALQIMDRITLSRAGNLNKEERDTLNNILYMRAQQFAAAQNYRLALSDLLRITPDFSRYGDARKKIKQYAQPKQLDQPIVTAGQGTQAQKPEAEKALRTEQVPSPEKVPSPVASKSKDNNAPAAQENRLSSDVAAGPPAVSDLHAPKITAKKVKDGTLLTTSKWNYTDDDVAKYDKMLADYFSVDRLSTRRTIKEGLGVSANNREPPSFKEWLDQGKPSF